MELSIIVPVYNVEKYIEECLKSLVSIKDIDYEIIVVNDGSKDGSLEIAKEYEKRYSKIKIISQENAGLSEARNVGIKNASGEYIAFIDSDDYIDHSEFEKFFEKVKKDGVDIGFGNYKRYIDNKNYFEPKDEKYIKKYEELGKRDIETGHSYFEYADKKSLYEPVVWKNLYRREFLLTQNLYFERGLIHEDELYSKIMVDRAKKVRYYNYFFYIYRIRENSIITSVNNEKKYHMYKIIEILTKELKESKSRYMRKQPIRVYLSAVRRNNERILSLEKELWKIKKIPLYKIKKMSKLWFKRGIEILENYQR